jgi:hypothetical protein
MQEEVKNNVIIEKNILDIIMKQLNLIIYINSN